ncbi:hypothetical protein Bbelb_318270 [Branchiostoma belcheri]|nr:hypothetical protein Bbelb_318270 [Branchiostoma belcheri]
MLRREEEDYQKVLEKIVEILPTANVTRHMMDFEKAMWSAMSCVLPDVRKMGCSFHWAQCLFRWFQTLGLQTTYLRKGATYKYLRQILSLPVLLPEEILVEWERLNAQATTPALRFTAYLDKRWVKSTSHPPQSWSVFKKVVRTNNDVEGWLNALNKRAADKCHLPFYLLLPQLQKEAALVELNIRLVRDQKLSRTQRKGSREAQEKTMKPPHACSLITAFRIIDPKNMPQDQAALRQYGTEELHTLLVTYGGVPADQPLTVDPEQTRQKWSNVRHVMYQRRRHSVALTIDSLWEE